MNIAINLDSNFLLPAMIGMYFDSQRENSRIRFGIVLVLNFSAFDKNKMNYWRKKIRNETEFNFYNACRVEKDLFGLNSNGPGAVSKLLLPELLPNDIIRKKKYFRLGRNFFRCLFYIFIVVGLLFSEF